MSMAVGPNRGVKNEINVTPLVDVVLVLLIIFMVVTPMLQRGKDVKLPEASEQKKKKEGAGEQDPLMLSVTRAKEKYVEKDFYADDASFKKRVEDELALVPNRRFMLKADQSLNYGDVRKVMKLTQDAGAKSIGLGVEEIKEGEEKGKAAAK